MRVLLIEDNPADILLMKEGLKEIGFCGDIHIEKDGESALDYLEHLSQTCPGLLPDVVLLDLNLPRIYGLEVLRQIRQSLDLSSLPVFILTTSESTEDIQHGYLLKANGFLSKPMDYPEFVSMLKGFMNFVNSWKVPLPLAA